MRKTKEYISDEQQKTNWASQVSEEALRKELELGKFPFPPSGQVIKNFQSTENSV